MMRWKNYHLSGPKGAPFILVGTKSDLSEEREIEFKQGDALAKKLGAPFIETSTKTNVNVEKIFLMLTEEILKKTQMLKISKSSDALFAYQKQNEEKDKAEDYKRGIIL